MSPTRRLAALVAANVAGCNDWALFAAVHESPVGTNAKCSDVRYLVAIRGKADVANIAFL